MRGRAWAVVAGALVLAVAPAAPAAAHPLGNFTVNHADHLLLTPSAVLLTAVVDRAEIPAAQALQQIAPDGEPSAEQLTSSAAAQCRDLAADTLLTVDGTPAGWEVGSTVLEVVPGAANLPTLRLTCELRAEVDLDRPAVVAFTDSHLDGPVGWREITADGDGVRLVDSPVPVESPSDQLRAYPDDLLSSPIDVRSFEVDTRPGENSGAGAAVSPASGDPFSSALAALDRRLQALIGGDGLTPLAGGLALLLAVLLGCGHALLPGHGKTVMAAYLAGRAGRPRDAVTVGVTVTVTHTVGVLLLGVALSVSSGLAGDQVLRWLGVVSGLLVAAIGGFMLRSALRTRRMHVGSPAARFLSEPALAVGTPALAGVSAGPSSAVHGHPTAPGTGTVAPHHHGHEHGHEHDHENHHDHEHGDEHGHHHDHDHGDERGHHHDHDHEHGDERGHHHDHDTHGRAGGHAHPHGSARGRWWSGVHEHGPGGHTHGPGSHSHGPGSHSHGPGRGGLVGMGVAGGLVPSPSALIVLLASIGLGRTVFGVVLVLAYGLGMAATLTAVGLTLVRVRDRLARRLTAYGSSGVLTAISRAAPVLTAALVLAVGLALVARGIVLGA